MFSSSQSALRNNNVAPKKEAKPHLQQRQILTPVLASRRAPAATRAVPSAAAAAAASIATSSSSMASSVQAALSAHWLALSGAAMATYVVFRLVRFAR